MSKVLIYSGFLRSWEKVRENHLQNIDYDDDNLHVYYSIDGWINKDCYIHWEKQLEEFSPAILTNHAPETQGGYILNALNQWRNRKKAFSEAPKGHEVYIITRFDIVFSGKIDFSKAEDGKIYIPTGNDYRAGVNDQFAFGNYRAVEQYCGLYDNWKKYFNEGLQFHPETYLKRQLRGLEIVRIPITNQIIR